MNLFVLLIILTPASEIHSHNTRYVANQNFFKPSVRTNYGISALEFSAAKIWEYVQDDFKCFPYIDLSKGMIIIIILNCGWPELCKLNSCVMTSIISLWPQQEHLANMKLILNKFFNLWFELLVHKIALAFGVILLARNNAGKLIWASIWNITTQIEFTKISCVTETLPLKFKKA